ncbi:MAG: hypothetical protein GX433_08900 [Deltaproteobacteria bacterium]|jgi:hypothetical protein|uniref:Uncharacterized protein n=1 Tax=Desulforhabdus amnigena TaxID=40218 RepID=A0A9W6FVB4_9BACT|nr:hypothetical protein [Deltaproteobacteria bacterium]GLI35492.1 hypothetical protein DAMNIGENAA_29250 [Desulforhabdus amnigena]
MAHDNIAFQERFPLSILACISLPFSFFVVTVPVMGVHLKVFLCALRVSVVYMKSNNVKLRFKEIAICMANSLLPAWASS